MPSVPKLQPAQVSSASAAAAAEAAKGQIRQANESLIPAAALGDYIRDKMRLSQQRPHASKVFANELLHGAPVLQTLLETELRDLVLQKAAVLDGWVAQGQMAPVNTVHLFFTIWSATQTYADFE